MTVADQLDLDKSFSSCYSSIVQHQTFMVQNMGNMGQFSWEIRENLRKYGRKDEKYRKYGNTGNMGESGTLIHIYRGYLMESFLRKVQKSETIQMTSLKTKLFKSLSFIPF